MLSKMCINKEIPVQFVIINLTCKFISLHPFSYNPALKNLYDFIYLSLYSFWNVFCRRTEAREALFT